MAIGSQTLPTSVATTSAPVDIMQDWFSRPYSQVFRDRVNYDVYDPATAEYMRGLDAYVRQFGLSDSPAMNIGGMTLDPKKITYKERSQFGLLPEYAYQDINNPVPVMPYGASLPPGIGNYSPTDYTSRISSAVTGKTPYEQLLNYQFAIAPHDEDQNTQWANVNYNTPIALIDNKTGKVIHAGIGFDAAMKIAEMSQNLSNTQGSKANYSIYTAAPDTSDWKYQAGDKPDKSVLGKIASVALPALGAILLPGVGGLAGALGSTGAAGLGAAAGSALSGTLQGQSIGDILKNAAIAGAATYAGGELFKGIGGTGGVSTAPSSSFSEAFSPEFMSSIAEGAAPAVTGGVASGIGGQLAGDTLGEGITVIGSKFAPGIAGVAGGIGGLTASQLTDNLSKVVSETKPDISGKGPSTLDKIRLGLQGASLLDQIFGGSGGTGGSVPGSGGPLNYSAMDRARATPNFDVFTYGQDVPGAQSGEFQFFNPTAGTTKLAEGGDVDSEPSDDMVKHLVAYQRGGGHMGPGQVKGIGSGQDDKIPAWLSDGEYVWSAQDVADLGDGSTDEGVRRLDKMRQMVRKQAGRKDVKKIAKPQKGIDHMLKAVGGRV